MKKAFTSNALSLIIVKVIFFSVFAIIFFYFDNQSNIEKLKGLTIQSKEEYLASYDKYVDDIEVQKSRLEKEIGNYEKTFVVCCVMLVFIVTYFLYQMIQLLISYYVWDKIRLKLGINYQATPRQTEDDILDNISV